MPDNVIEETESGWRRVGRTQILNFDADGNLTIAGTLNESGSP
jgi:hypothetical protein